MESEHRDSCAHALTHPVPHLTHPLLNTGWQVRMCLLTLQRVGLTQPSPSLKGKAMNLNCIHLGVLQKNHRDMWYQSHHCVYGETESQRGGKG